MYQNRDPGKQEPSQRDRLPTANANRRWAADSVSSIATPRIDADAPGARDFSNQRAGKPQLEGLGPCSGRGQAGSLSLTLNAQISSSTGGHMLRPPLPPVRGNKSASSFLMPPPACGPASSPLATFSKLPCSQIYLPSTATGSNNSPALRA